MQAKNGAREATGYDELAASMRQGFARICQDSQGLDVFSAMAHGSEPPWGKASASLPQQQQQMEMEVDTRMEMEMDMEMTWR